MGSLRPDDLMRIFVGLDLEEEIRAKIARFLDGVRGFAPDARWVRPESLHVTLKFIGEQKEEQVEAITDRLRKIDGSQFEDSLRGSRFLSHRKSAARVLDRN